MPAQLYKRPQRTTANLIMNADDIYKKYVAVPEPPVVEQDPLPNENKNKWKFPDGYMDLKLKEATQHLINEISIEVRDRLIAKQLKEKLCAQLDELHRRGL
jgi:hypothetical protein